ncbi:hypothetical protein RclHR1_19450005 [Rhizophagus clarus]|uniref:Homeobox domain-containing protein n=1 Tax=Rhizophagus clarus TaxID=94130 RepID=A0A2Z6RHJ4_9GLOM|nr:hypothetical protein RclHR1_19450005 [Rhizophagus clarus]GES98904.1 homeobox domain-containing protein [Rhizophagus clarus]
MKRTRVTPEQLEILEDIFKTNTSPNSKVRETLAEKLNMSERTIQIWFQNRRAKMKTMQKRAYLIVNQDSCPFRMPFSTSPLIAAQQQSQTQRFPIFPSASPYSNPMNTAQAVVNPTNGIPIKMNDQTLQQFTPLQKSIPPTFNNNNNTLVSLISCETLTIGTWHRVLTMSSPTDLLCYYTLPQNIFTYHITCENTQFKMEFSLSDIFSVEYRTIDDVYSQIAIEVKELPSFFMESLHGKWNTCTDFTGQQASRHIRHVLKGCSTIMGPQLIKLMQDDPNLAKVVTTPEDRIVLHKL